jgi:hypothetical protein
VTAARIWRSLLLDKLDAAVLSLRRIVGADGLGRTEACGGEPGYVDLELAQQHGFRRFGAPFREVEIVRRGPRRIGVPLNQQFQT